MSKIDNWYWQYGIKRGCDPSDPDREMRKVPIGRWLDRLDVLHDKIEAIRKNFGAKACVALWGPSQTGKSTMLSRYIDGFAGDGSDSALTWDPAHPVRFSPSISDGADLAFLYPNTLVFNPFNHQSDASGVAARYVLRDDGDPSVNPLYPVEIKLASRVQILHALALGYWTECHPIDQKVYFDQDHFLQDLPSNREDDVGAPLADAYDLLKDAAEVMELMRTEERFSNLFRRGEWEKKVRPQLVSCPALLSSVNAAEDKVTELFWDKSERLTSFFKRIESLRTSLLGKWMGAKRIVATQEVAALLLDIDTFRSFVEPNGDRGKKVQEKVSRIAWEFDGASGEVRLSVGKVGSEISGDAFGAFQVLCGELVVPLRRQALQDSAKAPFLQLVEKCDILDLPGLSNKNRGTSESIEDDSLLGIKTVSDSDLYTRVFKEGKTQSMVYGYSRQYGVDAFIILARANLWPGKSSLLSNGVLAWIRSYDPEWKKGLPLDMPVFLNMTFFASVVNNVAMDGVGNGLAPVVNRIQETLTFAGRNGATWFVTTYPQFPDGGIVNPNQKDTVVANIRGDEAFCPRTGLGEDAIRAVFEEDGGVGFMLERIAARIDPAKRLSRCRTIIQKARQEFVQMVLRHLPTDEESGADERRRLLAECSREIRNELSRIEQNGKADDYADLAGLLKDIFSASQDVFDPVPFDAAQEDQSDYLKRQRNRWFEAKMGNLPVSAVLDESHLQALVGTLRDAIRISGEGGLEEYVTKCLGQIKDKQTADAARFPFALAFGNVLRTGRWNRVATEPDPGLLDRLLKVADSKSREQTGSPYWSSIFEPMLTRLVDLEGVAKSGQRPPQPGDAELQEICRQIQDGANI